MINPFLDIAISFHNLNCTFLIGAGFSKHITDNNAPSWLELLVKCTEIIDKNNNLKSKLFVHNKRGKVIRCKVELPVCAQILEMEYKKEDKDLKSTVCELLRDIFKEENLNKCKIKYLQKEFPSYLHINIITTNYDTILSDYIFCDNSRVIVEESVIPRIHSGLTIYHIHGVVNKPSSLVLTIKDYHDFQSKESYFSRKFYTLLQESTVVILGYSLGDSNLNQLLSEVQYSKKETVRRSDIYYVTRDRIDSIYKEYYHNTYGIYVIDECDIETFFRELNQNIVEAREIISSLEEFEKVLNGEYELTDDYLKIRTSLPQIITQAGLLNIEPINNKFQNLIIKVLNKKKEYTYETNAWEQYEHLADWLIDVGSIININKSKIKKQYLEFIDYSLRKCSKVKHIGYSWAAYSIWRTRWNDMKVDNRRMIKKFIEKQFYPKDIRELLDIIENGA